MNPIFVQNFIGGMNSRDMGHLIADSEATQLDCGWFPNKALRSFPGDRRRTIDPATYPPVPGMDAGTAGGVPNDEPILGHWRYYWGDGGEHDAWVRVHGNVVEYWATGAAGWVQIGSANWPNTCIPTAVQFRDTIYIMHGTADTYYMCKFLTFNGTTWVGGDVPVPGNWTLGAVAFVGVGLNDMVANYGFTGNTNRFFVVEIERNLIGDPVQYGTGLNDITTGGVYVGGDARYIVEIIGVGPPDTFRWSDDGGLTFSVGIAIIGAFAHPLSNGVTVTFAAAGGHTLGDFWDFNCSPEDAVRWSWDGGGTWEQTNMPIQAAVAMGLDEGVTVTFAAAIGHTVGTYWQFDILVNDLPNLRPAFVVEYKDRLYGVSGNEPYRVRYSAIRNPRAWNPPGGGYLTIGESRGDPIKGLFVNNGKMYIFKKHSVWVFWIDEGGYKHLYEHRASGGLLNHKCICAMDDIIYYVTTRGVMALYGADYDCVSDKVHPSIEAHPEYLKYAQAIVHQESATIWVTFLVNIEETLVDESGGPEKVRHFHSHTWVGQIRRGIKTDPRWTRLPHHRITGYAMPPGDNNYRGLDNQNLRFDAQQPDVLEWNPNLTYPDAMYPTPAQGGARHYSYIWDVGYDRDVIPAIPQAYAGDNGIGWYMKYRSRRFMRVPVTRNLVFDRARLEYNVWKNQEAVGMDTGWGRVSIDEWWLQPDEPAITGDTHFEIGLLTPYDPNAGGACFQEWSLAECSRDFDGNPGAYGKTIMVEFEACGTANRARLSYALEFKDYCIEMDMPEIDMTTDRG